MTESRADEFRAYSRGLFDDMMCAEGEVILDRGCQHITELEAELAVERAARELAEAKLDKLAINFGDDYKL